MKADDLTQDEIHALGVNDSFVHTDFMIGSEDLSIYAVLRDGSSVPVFRNGTWAICRCSNAAISGLNSAA